RLNIGVCRAQQENVELGRIEASTRGQVQDCLHKRIHTARAVETPGMQHNAPALGKRWRNYRLASLRLGESVAQYGELFLGDLGISFAKDPANCLCIADDEISAAHTARFQPEIEPLPPR